MKQVLIILLFMSIGIKAQTISGIITDEKGDIMPYVTISLLQANDSTFVEGTTSDENGRFLFKAKSEGLMIKVSYIGYTTQLLKVKEEMHITMREEGVKVGDVVIMGHRPVYKMKDGELITSVQNTVLAKLGNANNVLAQLPLLTQKQGSYHVLGRGKPIIYINNRQISDSKELEEINSSDIKSISINLNPGSSYSAETAAVITIRTTRPVGEGLGGKIVSYSSWNGMFESHDYLNLNYRYKGLDVFFNGGYHQGSPYQLQDQRDEVSFIYNGIPFHADDDGKIKDNVKMFWMNTGMNYNFTGKQIAGVRYTSYELLQKNADIDFKGLITDAGKMVEYQSFKRTRAPRNRTFQIDAFYQNEISDLWQINLDFTYNNILIEKQENHQETEGDSQTEVGTESRTSSRLSALKVWSTNKFLEGLAEWGFEMTSTQNDQDYLMLNEIVSQFIPSTKSLFKQQSRSVFLSYSHSLGIFDAKAGIRYEHVAYDYEQDGVHRDDASRIYDMLFPFISLSYSNDHNSLNLSYRTQIKRPSYNQLKNEVRYDHSYSAQTGNPQLQPMTSHRLSLTARHHNWIFDASYSFEKNASILYPRLMTSRRMVIYDVKNHDNQTYDAILLYSPSFGIWKPSFQVGLSGQIMSFEGNNYNDISFNYGWKNLISWQKDWKLTFNLNGFSAHRSRLISYKPTFRADVSISKGLGNWQFYLGVDDIFNTERDRFNLNVNGVCYSKWDNMHCHSIYMQVSYTFNPAKSKYKGGQAGQSELQRM